MGYEYTRYAGGLGTNGKTSTESTIPVPEGYVERRDEYGVYQTSTAPIDPSRARQSASRIVDEVNMMIRDAQTGTEEQRFSGRQRLRDHLAHGDTVRLLRDVQSRWPQAEASRVLSVYENARRVSEGLPVSGETNRQNYILWGGIGLAAIIVIGTVVYALR